jgi:hypothetical protein
VSRRQSSFYCVDDCFFLQRSINLSIPCTMTFFDNTFKRFFITNKVKMSKSIYSFLRVLCSISDSFSTVLELTVHVSKKEKHFKIFLYHELAEYISLAKVIILILNFQNSFFFRFAIYSFKSIIYNSLDIENQFTFYNKFLSNLKYIIKKNIWRRNKFKKKNLLHTYHFIYRIDFFLWQTEANSFIEEINIFLASSSHFI